MVHQIVKLESKYRVFIETLILTLLILLIGFSLGFYVEYYRAKTIIDDYKYFEIDVLDLKLQNYYYQIIDSADCKTAIQENLNFADRIYEKGLAIEKAEESSELIDNIIIEKKKYVLLKTELWLNSILLKKKCNNPFHTVAYIYSQKKDLAKQAEQDAISKTLEELKQEKGNNIILLPIAGDIDLPSVDMQLRIYNVTYLPSIIIDEKIVLESYHNIEELEKYLKQDIFSTI